MARQCDSQCHEALNYSSRLSILSYRASHSLIANSESLDTAGWPSTDRNWIEGNRSDDVTQRECHSVWTLDPQAFLDRRYPLFPRGLDSLQA